MELKNILQFAYLMQEYDGVETEAIVRVTLQESGLDVTHFQGSPRKIGDACRLIRIVAGSRGTDSSAIVAKFSHNSHVNFKAKVALAQHFRAALHDHTRHFDLLVKLVERHYLEPAERIGAWSIPAISDQFRASRTRIEQAQAILSQHIDQLETVALDNLRRELEQKKLFNHATEVA